MGETSNFSSEMLKVYYAKLFPYSEMYQWISYGNGKNFPGSDQTYLSRREFSFTLEQDIYVRYQSFKDQGEMEQSIKEKNPHKIDIGPVFNVDPAKRNAYQNLGSEKLFAPVERELVFDIDISDYDDVRTCCTGASVCLACWPLMNIAIKVLDYSLRNDFGFSHLLWVFSGRRGVHCWVCDERARKLTNEQRSAIAEYFRVYKGNENNGKRVSLPSILHPFLSKAYSQVLRKYFEDRILPGQLLLTEQDSAQKILDFIPDSEVVSSILSIWMSDKKKWPTSEEENLWRWKVITSKVASGVRKNHNLRKCIEEIVFTYTYPRIDLEVSKHMNHLLKAPFCVHPKTGKVCTPINPEDCDSFDPTTVPVLSNLLDDLNKEVTSEDARAMECPDQFSFQAAIKLFQEVFLKPLLRDTKQERLQKHKLELQQSIPGVSCIRVPRIKLSMLQHLNLISTPRYIRAIAKKTFKFQVFHKLIFSETNSTLMSKCSEAIHTKIDYTKFKQIIPLRALRVPKEICNDISKLLRGHLFQRPKLPHILIDPQDSDIRLVLLHPKIEGSELNGLPEEKILALKDKGVTQNVSHNIELDHLYWSADDILEKLLPPGVEVPTSFETIGHVAHVNLRDELLPFKFTIGQVLLDKNSPRIRTVVNKVGTIESEFRVPTLEVLAGDLSLETSVKQHGATFLLNYGTVYWNSRLESEHKRLVSTFLKPGEVVCDMFAGIGPFAVPAAMAGCFVFANDLNPDSILYLEKNCKKNKVEKRVKAFNLDAREFMLNICSKLEISTGETIFEVPPKGKNKGGPLVAVKEIKLEPWKHFDHVIMNLPASAIEFLDVFSGLLSREEWEGNLPMIHCYCFAKASETEEEVVQRACGVLGGQISDPQVWNVRDVAPKKTMLCLSFRLPPHVAFSRAKEGSPNLEAKRPKLESDLETEKS